MTERAKAFLRNSLCQAISEWMEKVSIESDAVWVEVGWCGENLESTMADAAMCVLVANAEASQKATEEENDK